jgi:hypothetical protein
MAVIVPIVSKKSASISVKTSSSAATMPTDWNEPSRLNSRRVAKSGFPEDPVRPVRNGQAPPGRVLAVGRLGVEPAEPFHDDRDKRGGEDRDEDRALDLAHPQRHQEH